MGDYTLVKLDSSGATARYEVRLPDGARNVFYFTSDETRDEDHPDFQHWLGIARRRAKRNSEYLVARHG